MMGKRAVRRCVALSYAIGAPRFAGRERSVENGVAEPEFGACGRPDLHLCFYGFEAPLRARWAAGGPRAGRIRRRP